MFNSKQCTLDVLTVPCSEDVFFRHIGTCQEQIQKLSSFAAKEKLYLATSHVEHESQSKRKSSVPLQSDRISKR